MGKLTGAIQFQGTVGNVTADKNGTLKIKQASRPATAVRTLENNSEFGTVASAKKIFVDASRSVVGSISVATHGMLMSKFAEIKNADAVSVRGQRGILDAECELLKGFQLNDKTSFDGTFYPYPVSVIDRVGGLNKITVPAYNASSDLNAPQGTTHYQFKAAAMAISFENGGLIEKVDVRGAMTALNGVAVPTFDLAVPLTANQTGVIFLEIGIDFYQEINGQKYELQNGLYNPTSVIDVLGA